MNLVEASRIRWLLHHPELSPGAKLVTLSILDHLEDDADHAFPSYATIAFDCSVNLKTVRLALHQLVAAGVIDVERGGPTRSNHYRPGPALRAVPDGWRASEAEREKKPVGEKSPYRKKVQRVREKTPEVGELFPSSVPKSVPSSVPKKTSRVDPGAVERLYKAYPRQIGKSAAVKAIEKAIKLVTSRNGQPDSVGWLLERVRAFAASPMGNPEGPNKQFIPYPSTWFNQGRYDDDEKEWGLCEDGRKRDIRYNARYRHLLPAGKR